MNKLMGDALADPVWRLERMHYQLVGRKGVDAARDRRALVAAIRALKACDRRAALTDGAGE